MSFPPNPTTVPSYTITPNLDTEPLVLEFSSSRLDLCSSQGFYTTFSAVTKPDNIDIATLENFQVFLTQETPSDALNLRIEILPPANYEIFTLLVELKEYEIGTSQLGYIKMFEVSFAQDFCASASFVV